MSSSSDAGGLSGPIGESLSLRETGRLWTEGVRVLPSQGRPIGVVERRHGDAEDDVAPGTPALPATEPLSGSGPVATECPAWLRAGARALDIATGRTGVVQFLQSEDREVRTDAHGGAKRARLRPVDSGRPGWWAEIGTLRWNIP